MRVCAIFFILVVSFHECKARGAWNILQCIKNVLHIGHRYKAKEITEIPAEPSGDPSCSLANKNSHRTLTRISNFPKQSAKVFLWHFIQILRNNTHRKVYDIELKYLSNIRIGSSGNEKAIKQQAVYLGRGCSRIIDQVRPEFKYNYHKKALAGMILGSVEVMQMWHVFNDVDDDNGRLIKWMSDHVLVNGLLSCDSIETKFTDFLLEIKSQAYNLVLNDGNDFNERIRIVDLFEPAKCPDDFGKQILDENHRTYFTRISNVVNSQLYKIFKEVYDQSYATYAGLAAAPEGLRDRYGPIFRILFDYIDVVMFMIDTAAMKELMVYFYDTVHFDPTEYKEKMIEFLEELYKILTRRYIAEVKNDLLKKYIKILGELLTKLDGRDIYTEMSFNSWIKNEVMLKVTFWARQCIEQFPPEVWDAKRLQKEKKLKKLSGLLEKYPLQMHASGVFQKVPWPVKEENSVPKDEENPMATVENPITTEENPAQVEEENPVE